AAPGWTSYPPLSGLPQNPGFTDAVGSLPQTQGSTWPMAPVIMNYVAQFMMAAYICAYYIRLGNNIVNVGVSVLLSLIFATFMVRGVQHVAYDGQSCWFLSLFWLGFSSLMGAVNYLTTIIKLRCPGMTMFRLPLSVWSLFITSILVLLATPVLAATLLMNLLEHQQIAASIAGSSVRMVSFFTPYNWTLSQTIQGNSGGGYVLLH